MHPAPLVRLALLAPIIACVARGLRRPSPTILGGPPTWDSDRLHNHVDLKGTYDRLLDAQPKNRVNTAGSTGITRLKDSLLARTSGLNSTFAHKSLQQREQALGAVQARFNSLTRHEESLRQSAEHELLAIGYSSARNATARGGSARIDSGKLKRAAHFVWFSFKNASNVWEETRNFARNVEQSGLDTWARNYTDPNSTLALITKSVRDANSFIDESAASRLEVRWSKTAASVASDVSTAAQIRSEGVDSQVRTAQDRAMQALRMTSANSGKLDTLEAMVAKVEEDSEIVTDAR